MQFSGISQWRAVAMSLDKAQEHQMAALAVTPGLTIPFPVGQASPIPEQCDGHWCPTLLAVKIASLGIS